MQGVILGAEGGFLEIISESGTGIGLSDDIGDDNGDGKLEG